MSVVASSALVSVLMGEPGWEALQTCLEEAQPWRISAVTLVEACMVVESCLGLLGRAQLDAMLLRIGVEVRPMTAETAVVALDGWRRFGRGRHPARLNFGDCFSYALAMELDEALLFVGNDFGMTDVVAAVA